MRELLLGRMSLYLFLSSAPGGTSAIVTRLDGIDWTEKEGGRGRERGREREGGKGRERGRGREIRCQSRPFLCPPLPPTHRVFAAESCWVLQQILHLPKSERARQRLRQHTEYSTVTKTNTTKHATTFVNVMCVYVCIRSHDSYLYSGLESYASDFPHDVPPLAQLVEAVWLLPQRALARDRVRLHIPRE